MSVWYVLLWSLAVVGAGAAVYGFHRFCLYLEQRGWLYYKYKKPSGSASRCLSVLQEALEPQSQHVFQIKEEKSHQAVENTAEANGPKPAGARDDSDPA